LNFHNGSRWRFRYRQVIAKILIEKTAVQRVTSY
jgi:hypothetical protein